MNRPTLLLALVPLFLVGCVDRAKQDAAKKTEQFASSAVTAVTLTPAASKTLRETVEITGEVTTGEDVQVSAKLAGRIEAVYVRDGDRVSANQVVAILDRATLDAQVSQAQAQIAQARSGLQQALNNAALRPAQSASAIASARQQARAAEAGVRQAKSRLALTLKGARSEDRRQAQAQLDSAKTALDTQEKQLTRVRVLVKEGALAGQQLDLQQSQFAQAQAAFRSAQEAVRTQTNGARPDDIENARQVVRQFEAQYAASLEAVRSAAATQRLDVTLQDAVNTARATVQQAEAGLRIAQRNVEDASIRAPFAGVVNGKPLQAGTVVAPGVAVVALVGEEGAYFEGTVPDALVDRVKPGSAVEVTLSPSNDKFQGRVATVSPTGDSVARQFRARVVLTGDRSKLRPGLFARGLVILRTVENATVVPAGAVVKVENGFVVFTSEQGKAKAVPVTLGLKERDDQEVLGLAAGTSVVTAGQVNLKEGTAIQTDKPVAAISKQGAN